MPVPKIFTTTSFSWFRLFGERSLFSSLARIKELVSTIRRRSTDLVINCVRKFLKGVCEKISIWEIAMRIKIRIFK